MKTCLYNERSDPGGAGARSRLWDDSALRDRKHGEQS